MSKLGE